MGICVAYGIESVLTGTFTCIPVYAFWDLMKKPTANCLNENAFVYLKQSMVIHSNIILGSTTQMLA
jgi:hypothetical protein